MTNIIVAEIWHTSILISIEQIPRNGLTWIKGLQSVYTFDNYFPNSLRNCCTNLYSYQLYITPSLTFTYAPVKSSPV